MKYPITITRDQLIEAEACEEGIAAFDQVAPAGTLTIPDVSAHVALLSSPLAPFEAWAIEAEVVQPIVVSAGDYGTTTAGDYGTATTGDRGTATAGFDGTASAGDYGTATTGYRGTATAGDRGTATTGDYGTATTGYRGTATTGDRGTATAGFDGIITIKWWDRATFRYRLLTGYVGEDGIKPNTPYRVEFADGAPRFVEVTA